MINLLFGCFGFGCFGNDATGCKETIQNEMIRLFQLERLEQCLCMGRKYILSLSCSTFCKTYAIKKDGDIVHHTCILSIH